MAAAAESWEELFPETDYEFRLTLRRGAPHAFFARGSGSAAVLQERCRWLDDDRDRYLRCPSEAEGAVDELVAEAATWPEAARLVPGPAGSSGGRLEVVGRQWEADVLLLSPDPHGDFVLRGGVLCFPTGWALEEKIGLPLDAIHGVVPGLNEAVGASIRQFLTKLRPGDGYLRQNWGLAATDELNLHPIRGIPGPRLPVRLEALWLRVERQILFRLPRSGAIAFGIKIDLYRMDRVAGHPAALRVRRALASMRPELASYKRIAEIRSDLIKLLC